MKNKTQIINNLKIAYLDNEVNSNIAIVFIHGNSQSSKSYAYQLKDDLLNNFRLIALDLPGHGDSDSATNYTLPLFTNTVVGFCDSLKLKNFVIVGHSLGGHFTIQSLPKLKNCIGVFIIGASPLNIPLIIEDAYLPSELMALLFKKELTKTEINQFATSITTNTVLIENDIKNTDAKFREHLAVSIGNGEMHNEVDILKNATVPIAMVFGINDSLVNTNYVANLTIPMLWNAQLIFIENALHCPQLDSPKELNAILIDFIESIK